MSRRIERFDVNTPFQPGPQSVRVAVPSSRPRASGWPCIYVLPVEAGDEGHYGDGLTTLVEAGVHESAGAVLAAPRFGQLPWYADHPTDPRIRQESHFVRGVVPAVEARYPVIPDRRGRWLLGFSKSGWGAFGLLLRWPGMFGKAVAWDAPLMLDRPGPYGSGPILGTPANFARYHLPSQIERSASELQGAPRLFHLAEGNFRAEHWQFEALLERLNVPHGFVNGPTRDHRWDSGWLAQAVSLLRDG